MNIVITLFHAPSVCRSKNWDTKKKLFTFRQLIVSIKSLNYFSKSVYAKLNKLFKPLL